MNVDTEITATFKILLDRYEILLRKVFLMEVAASQPKEVAQRMESEVDMENRKALLYLSMALGNPAVEWLDTGGLAGGLVRYVLDRLKRAESCGESK